MTKHRLVLKHQYALGDTVLFTGLIRDIERAYPGRFQIDVLTNWTPIWWNNPYVTNVDKVKVHPGAPHQLIEVGWNRAIHQNGRFRNPDGTRSMTHILYWYHRDFCQKTGLVVPCTEPKADLHMTAAEQKPIIEGRYWIVMAGGKLDLTNKHWHYERYQEVVTELSSRGLRFVQCGATHEGHIHPPLAGAVNMVGKTDNVRDFLNLVQHCEGVISPVTAAMHIAAAFDKPCVVLAGGREEPWFEAYYSGFDSFGPGCPPVKTPHRFLHTIGKLHCCDVQGCWKTRTVPLEPDDLGKDAYKMCREPIRLATQAIASCMDMIRVDHVVKAVMDYYDSKVLPPIDTTPPAETPAAPAGDGPPPLIRIPQLAIQTADLQILRAPSGAVREQRPHQQQPPKEYAPKSAAEQLRGPSTDVLDNPIIGGKFTVCVLCYGPHHDLAKRCLDSILTTVPRHRLDLRIATNEAEPKTIDYVRSLEPDKLYVNAANRKKYPVMRDMFHDPRAPFHTRYLIWFDDDAYAVDPRWHIRLAESIIANHKHGCRLYGAKMWHDLQMYAKNGHQPQKWFQQGEWYRGVHFRANGQERLAPNGSCIDFVAGWFWAIETSVIHQANLPDTRLNHNGGDITIGAQVLQAGHKIKEFNKGKVFVYTPPKEQGGRRGYREGFPWAS